MKKIGMSRDHNANNNRKIVLVLGMQEVLTLADMEIGWILKQVLKILNKSCLPGNI